MHYLIFWMDREGSHPWIVGKAGNANFLERLIPFICDNHTYVKPGEFMVTDDPDLGIMKTKQFDCCVIERGRKAKGHVAYDMARG